MRAVGAGTRHDLGTVIDDKRDVARLHHGGDVLCPFDQRAFAVVGKAQQYRGDVAGAECTFKLAGKERRIADRRGDQIKPRRGLLVRPREAEEGAEGAFGRRTSAVRRREASAMPEGGEGGGGDVTPLCAQDRLSIAQAWQGRSSWRGD